MSNDTIRRWPAPGSKPTPAIKKFWLNLGFFSFSLLSAVFLDAERNLGSSPDKLSFDRDTVIVWTGENRGYNYDFVIRLAVWQPERYFEWENKTTQGTVLLGSKALNSSRSFYASKFFDAGADVKVNNETTIWISRDVFNELEQNGRVKMKVDGLDSFLTLVGRDKLEAVVNQQTLSLPTVVARDGRGGEWWFLDDADNPILLKYKFRTFTQTIKSITTNKKNTLRWIKESKINKLTH